MALANINGQEIYFEDTCGNGPVLIFMHGFLLDHSIFDAQVAELASDYRCIRWDARGFGRTRWDGKAFTLYDSVNDCFGLMDHLGVESAILVGMSEGGYCALRAALTYPGRVKGLVLMSTQAEADSESKNDAYREMRDTWRELGPVTPLMEGLATAILGPADEPGMTAHWDKWLPLWKQITNTAIFHTMNNLLERDEITPLLHKITCPVLITHGADDSAIPPSIGEALSKKLSDCRGFIVSPGAHSVNMTHPEIINPPLKKFLSEICFSLTRN